MKFPGAVVGNTWGTVFSYSLGMSQLSKKKYRLRATGSPARAATAQEWAWLVWFITKSRQQAIPRSWQAAVRSSRSAMVPSSGWTVRKSATA